MDCSRIFTNLYYMNTLNYYLIQDVEKQAQEGNEGAKQVLNLLRSNGFFDEYVVDEQGRIQNYEPTEYEEYAREEFAMLDNPF